MGWVFVIALVLMLVGGLPTWHYSRNWGYGPSSALGLMVVVILLLAVNGFFPLGFLG